MVFVIDKPLLAGNPSRQSGSGEPAEAGQGSGVTDKAHPRSASLLFHACVCCARLCIENVLISPTDTELLNNQGSSLDKCWLVHLNQAHCVQRLINTTTARRETSIRRMSDVTTDGFLRDPRLQEATKKKQINNRKKAKITIQKTCKKHTTSHNNIKHLPPLPMKCY